MPGTVVQVTVPASLATVGATLHIGGFTDTLYDHTQWARLPEIVRWYPVSSTVTKISSALGGLIYLTLPEGLGLGTVQVSVKGEEWRLQTRASSGRQSIRALRVSECPLPFFSLVQGVAQPRCTSPKGWEAGATSWSALC